MNTLHTLDERYRSPDYWTARLQLELYDVVREYLSAENLSQNKFAEQLGVSKGYMSQVMNGDFDHRLSKLVSLALATGKVPEITYRDVEGVIQRARGQYKPLRSDFVSPERQRISFRPTQVAERPVLQNTKLTAKNVIFKDVA